MSKPVRDEIEDKLTLELTVNELARLLHSSVLTYLSHKTLRSFPTKGYWVEKPEFVEGESFWFAVKQIVVQLQAKLHMGQYTSSCAEYAATEVTVDKTTVSLIYSYVVKTPAEEEGDFLYYLGIPEGFSLRYDAHVVFTATGAILNLSLESSLSPQDAWDKEMDNSRSIEFIMDL